MAFHQYQPLDPSGLSPLSRQQLSQAATLPALSQPPLMTAAPLMPTWAAQPQPQEEPPETPEPASPSCCLCACGCAAVSVLVISLVFAVLFLSPWAPQGSEKMGLAEQEFAGASAWLQRQAQQLSPVPRGAAASAQTAPKQTPRRSLFCWAVIMANSSEELLLREHYPRCTNIFRCDAWLLLSDFPVRFQDVVSIPIGAFNSKRAPWNSWYNVPVFLRAWSAVLKDGQYLDYNWTVKADMDTFFCPERLRSRLSAAEVPADEACFWKNYDAEHLPGPLDFLGPLEILSQGTMKLYRDRHATVCPRPHPQTQGEDGFMKDCLLKLGARARTDHALLLNACDWCDPLTPEQCADTRYVAFHPFKTPAKYSRCEAAAKTC